MKKHFLVTVLGLFFLINETSFANDTEWEDSWSEFEEDTDESNAWSWETSFEASTAFRTRNDSAISNDATLAEIRNNWSIYYEKDNLKATLKLDLFADNIDSDKTHQVREANAYYRVSEQFEFKIGRQILTWGTGDLIFLNDMFPKDWQSFFSGRDTQDLKAPSDTLKTSIYTSNLNFDIIYTPQFDSDEFINGERLSYYSPVSNQYEAAPPALAPIRPNKAFEDDEISLRISTNKNGSEYAIYYYDGFFKSPVGLSSNDTTNGLKPIFPALKSYGASIRTSTSAGLVNAEFARYKSIDDSSGNNPLIPNDQDRLLIGFETEAATNVTLGFQYYLEKTKDYEALRNNSPFPKLETREYRHLWTNRVTYQTNDRLWTYSLFTFYSTSDKDGYLRPSVSYRYSDHLHLFGGGNFIFGDDNHTFFNRFENNSNIYLRLKYYL